MLMAQMLLILASLFTTRTQIDILQNKLMFLQGQLKFCVSKDTYFYLEEGDSIRAVASAASDLELVIGYEDIS